MARPQWHEGVGDFYATLTRRAWRSLGLPQMAGRTIVAHDVSPIGVAGKVYDAFTGEYYGGRVSVVLHGEQARDHARMSARCRRVQRRRRRPRRQRISRRGF